MGAWWERNGRAVAGAGLLGVLFVATGVLAAVGSGGARPGSTGGAESPALNSSSSTTMSADGREVASGFRATGVWFIDESQGWVIGGGCGPGRCARFMRTSDGGRSWEPLAAPSIAGTGKADDVTDVRFADPRNGWAFDRGLWSTHDGGATWHAVDVGSPVLSLETAGSTVYVLVGSCRVSQSDCRGPVRLYQASVESDDWRPVFDIDVGSPASPNGRLVVSGPAVYALVHPHYGSPRPGKPPTLYALSAAGRWEPRPLPASCWLGGVLAAASPGNLFLSCQTGDGAGGSAPHEFHVSRDGGVRWTRTWEGRSVYFGPIVVTSDAKFLAESTEDLRIDRPDGSRQYQRFTYSPELRCGERIHALQFVTGRQGVALTCHQLYITRDAGHRWDLVPLEL